MWTFASVILVVVVVVIAVALGLVLRRVNYGVRKALFPRVQVGILYEIECLIAWDTFIRPKLPPTLNSHVISAVLFTFPSFSPLLNLSFIQVERVLMDQTDSPPFTARCPCGGRKSKTRHPRYVPTEVLRSHHTNQQPKVLIVIIPGAPIYLDVDVPASVSVYVSVDLFVCRQAFALP